MIFIFIIDLTHRRDRVSAVVGTDDQRLRLIIGNTANAKGTVHGIDILVKLCPKRSIFNVMYGPVKTLFIIIHSHTGPSRPQVGMIVCPEEQVKHTIFL